MKKAFFTLLIVLPLSLLGQTEVDPERIKADTAFTCNDKIDSLHTAYFDLDKICNSEYQIEIRLYSQGRASISTRAGLIKLTFDGSKWSATKYSYYRPGLIFDNIPTVEKKSFPLSAKPDFQTLFNDLKDNHIFSLPDFYHSRPNNISVVLDGDFYRLDFKAGNALGSYSFDNPHDYANAYPQVDAFKNYATIVDILNNRLISKAE